MAGRSPVSALERSVAVASTPPSAATLDTISSEHTRVSGPEDMVGLRWRAAANDLRIGSYCP